MKKQKCTLLAAILILSLLLSGCGGKTPRDISDLRKDTIKYNTIQPTGTLTPTEADLEGWTPAQENDYLALYYSEKTAAVKVFDKRTGGWWSTNPDSASSNAASSQLTLSTISLKGVVKEYSSSFDAVDKGQVEFKNGSSLKVIYTFGNVKPDLSMVPSRLTNERFEELQKRVEEAGGNKKLLGRRYTQGDDGIWIRKETLTVDQSKKLRELFESIGYTSQELAKDNAEAGGAVEEASSSFSIPLEYVLDGDSLCVRISGEDTEYPTSEIITAVNVLSYFGAQQKDADAYFLVPNGSGALVNTEEQNSRSGIYELKLYGDDYTLPVERKSGVDMENLMPVFGISRAKDGVFAIIEDNDAVASVVVSKAGHVDLWNTVGASFALNSVENIGLSSDAISKFYITSQVKYAGDTSLRYIFLTEENRTYSGMAKVYRDYLDKQQNRSVMTEKGDMPLFVETVGALEGTTSTLGIVHEHKVALTTFDDNKIILDDLKSAGISNVKLILSGWANGGADQRLLDSLDIVSELGGKKKLEGLIEYAEKMGAKVYPKLLFNTFSSKDSLSNKNNFSAKTLGSKKSVMNSFDKLTGVALPSQTRCVLSPTYQYEISRGLLKDLNKKKIGNVLLGDIATTAYSDYNKDSEALRQYSMMQAAEITALYADKLDGLMLAAPNVATARYSALYTDVPASSGSYMAEDRSVPFYQMVYHGYADYSFAPLNFTSDFTANYLKCVEYGGNLKFRFIINEDAKLSPEEEAEEYASQYSRWKEQMKESYLAYNELLSPVRNSVMVGHELISQGVYRTDYDNGISIYVNYNKTPALVGGITVPAQQAVRVEGGK